MYRIGNDSSLRSMTYGEIHESLAKITNNKRLAQDTQLPPNPNFSSQLSGLGMPAGLGLLPPPGAALSLLMPSQL